MPKPILDVTTATTIPAEYQMAKALEDMGDLTDATKKRELRNRVAAVYLAAADARYHEFRSALAKDMKGSNFGLDLGVLGLSGLGSIAKGAANEFSAGAAALTGTRASLNKELYFEKTLPALIVSMEANRLKPRGEIMRHLREDDVVQYPLEQAFADIANYQMAASLDGAIEQITTAAGQAAAIEVQNYENALKSCGPTSEVAGYWGRLNDFVYGLSEGAAAGVPAAGTAEADQLADLAQTADILGLAPATAAANQKDAEAQAAAIMAKAASYCTQGALTSLFDQISSKTGRVIQ